MKLGMRAGCQPENDDCYHFWDSWEFVTDRATINQQRLFRPKEQGFGGFWL